MMKRAAAFILVLVLSISAEAQSSARRDPETDVVRRCRQSSLQGAFIYVQDGFTVAGTEAAQRTPFAQAGREVYDGAGGVTGSYTASLNGSVVRGTYSGSYSVAPDCSGTVTFTDNLGQTYHYDIYIMEGSDEFAFIQTDPGVVSASFERRRPAAN